MRGREIITKAQNHLELFKSFLVNICLSAMKKNAIQVITIKIPNNPIIPKRIKEPKEGGDEGKESPMGTTSTNPGPMTFPDDPDIKKV